MAREEAFSLVYSNALDNEGASLLPGDINDTQILLDPVLGAIDKVGQRWKGTGRRHNPLPSICLSGLT